MGVLNEIGRSSSLGETAKGFGVGSDDVDGDSPRTSGYRPRLRDWFMKHPLLSKGEQNFWQHIRQRLSWTGLAVPHWCCCGLSRMIFLSSAWLPHRDVWGTGSACGVLVCMKERWISVPIFSIYPWIPFVVGIVILCTVLMAGVEWYMK